MKIHQIFIMLILVVMVSTSSPATVAGEDVVDPGWPRVVTANGNELIIYQPQVDFWKDHKELGFRCAISVKTAGAKEAKFGIAEVEAKTETDNEKRTVVLIPKKRELRFSNIPEKEANQLLRVVDELQPQAKEMTISLDLIVHRCGRPIIPIQERERVQDGLTPSTDRPEEERHIIQKLAQRRGVDIEAVIMVLLPGLRLTGVAGL